MTTDEPMQAFLAAMEAVDAAHEARAAALSRCAMQAEVEALDQALEHARQERGRARDAFMRAHYASGPAGAVYVPPSEAR